MFGFIVAIIFVFGVLPGMLCWPYVINFWLVFAGKAAVVVWWQGALIGFVPGLGELTIPAAVLTWIFSLFI